ncbi:hypothetical protein ACFPIJ_33630 [Dactylosporangium cerinum]|uniref:Uncharacterized protein n=1 Tax=Dactylosporangium cerinum TaxID=1434730 RepID=A0ABV9W298_9ACTN
MRIEAELVDDVDGGLVELLGALQADPGLEAAEPRRGQTAVRSDELGTAEVVELIATDVLLPMVVQALYDFLSSRVRRGSETAKIVVTRTDLPDGERRVEITLDGSSEAAVEVVRRALEL